MSYDALIAKWSTLSGTTQSKLDQINALTVTGSIPTTLYVTGDQVFNCINWAEFAALTAQQQSNILAICQTPGQLLGGSANTTHMLDGMLLAYFPLAGPTIANLTAFAQAVTQPWWQATVAQGGGGLGGPVTNQTLVEAGHLS